jgi:hypothetical protein
MKPLSLTGIILVMLAFFEGGCSFAIRKGGFRPETVLHEGADRATIQAELKSPTMKLHFDAPLPLIDALGPQSEPVPICKQHSLVLSREDYQYRGRLYRNRRSIDRFALDWGTLYLAEIILFPEAVFEALGESNETHVFEVWYSPDGKYVYHRVRTEQ